MHDPQEHPNGTELEVSFISQDCHIIAATNLSYSCRASRGILETGSCSAYPFKSIVLPRLVIKQPESAWSWGHPEDEALFPPNPPYAIKRDFKNLFCQMVHLKNAASRCTWEGATDVGDGILPGGS